MALASPHVLRLAKLSRVLLASPNVRSVTMASNNATWIQAQDDIKKLPLVVFAKSYCPWCTKADNLLQELGARDFLRYDLDKMENGAKIQTELEKISGLKTVPNVFVGGKSLGGFSDINALHKDGQLLPALKAARVQLKGDQTR